MTTNLIFDRGLAPVIRDLLPAGVRAIGKIKRAGNSAAQCCIQIKGERLPKTEHVRMLVQLDLIDNVPIRTVTLAPVAV